MRALCISHSYYTITEGHRPRYWATAHIHSYSIKEDRGMHISPRNLPLPLYYAHTLIQPLKSDFLFPHSTIETSCFPTIAPNPTTNITPSRGGTTRVIRV